MKWLFIATRKRYFDALNENQNEKADVYRLQLENMAKLINISTPELWTEIKMNLGIAC